MSRADRWIIVGGGASGLAAAYFLRGLGLPSVIVERESTIGGRMATVQLGERSVDCGGKNIGRRYTLFRRFAASLGSHPFEHFGLNSSQSVNGKVTTVDAGARWQTMARLARGIRPGDMVRFGSLLCRVASSEPAGYLGSSLSQRLGDRYDSRSADRYFSPQFCQRFIRPMSVRMNGAEPDEVYVGNLGSNARMILDTYDQFARGLAPLFTAFREQYEVVLNTATEGLLVSNGRAIGVRVRDANGATGDLFGAGVIVATPANLAAALIAPAAPDVARQLESIAYYPVALVVAEYDRAIFSPGVRAFVFDDGEPVSNAGAYGVNDLNIVRYTVSGRAARRHLAEGADPEALLGLSEAALSKFVPVDAAWRRRFVAKRFNTGLCAYAPHHARLMQRVDDGLSRVSGLYLTGDYVQGASIEACFRSAQACTRRLAAREAGDVRKSA